MDVLDPNRWSGSATGQSTTAPEGGKRPSPGHVVPIESAPAGADSGLETILESFIVGVTRMVGARAGVVRSLTPDGTEMRVLAMTGLPEEVRRREAAAGSCGVCADAVRRADVCMAVDPGSCGEIANAAIFGNRGRGTVAVPLDYKGRTVGVFTLFFDGVSDVRADVIHLLRPIGQLLGVTLENAKLQHDRLRDSLLRERQSMAGDIHDSLAQSLTFVRMRLPLLKDAIRENQADAALKYCADVHDELGNANRRLRDLITHFRAGMDAQGLGHALEQTRLGFFERTGIALDIENEVADLALPVGTEVQVFHIVQEALVNIHRHSLARRARVSVRRQDDQMVFTIEDDGVGWDSAPIERESGDAGSHFGLEIMRERAAGVGGRIEFDRAAMGGARLRLHVPLLATSA
ncbi:MAG: histidine kinase [Burkholderiaceae bacterium]